MSEAPSLVVGLVWSAELNCAALLCSSCSYRAWWFPSFVAPKAHLGHLMPDLAAVVFVAFAERIEFLQIF